MSTNNLKCWSQPKLIVLVRGTAEENVLQGCKATLSTTGNGPTNGACFKNQVACVSPCPQLGNS